MRKPLLFLVAGLAAGFAFSAWLAPRAPARADRAAAEDLAPRVAALEASLEKNGARLAALATEVAELRSGLREATARGGGDTGSRGAQSAAASSAPSSAPEQADASSDPARFSGPRFRGRPGVEDNGESRIARFIAAGFSADRAAYLDRRVSELRMQALEAQYAAARSGKPPDPSAIQSPEQALRQELGDADYERYLTALGWPTRVGVRSVLASSPAEQAGLQPGDEITSYDGHRVFDTGDLNRLTYQGQAGETVALDIVRNGEPMQIYVPRGPLGITGGRGRFGGGP
jgi:hypothetical protein